MKDFYVSKAGYEKLQFEYNRIEEAIQKTKSEMEGNASKRSHTTKEEFRRLNKAMNILPAQKEEIASKLKNAIIIEESDEYKNFDGSTVIIGSKITLLMSGIEKTLTILGNSEGNIKENIISCDTPLAQVIIGKGVRCSFRFRSETIVIKKIERI